MGLIPGGQLFWIVGLEEDAGNTGDTLLRRSPCNSCNRMVVSFRCQNRRLFVSVDSIPNLLSVQRSWLYEAAISDFPGGDGRLSLAEELQADVGQLAQTLDQHTPSLGLSAQI